MIKKILDAVLTAIEAALSLFMEDATEHRKYWYVIYKMTDSNDQTFYTPKICGFPEMFINTYGHVTMSLGNAQRFSSAEDAESAVKSVIDVFADADSRAKIVASSVVRKS